MILLSFPHPKGGTFSIPKEWFLIAGMENFQSKANAYRTENGGAELTAIHTIARPSLDQRIQGLPCGFRRDDMIRVLRGIVEQAAMPPIEIVRTPHANDEYYLKNGAHRYFASIAAGFTFIPTTPGWVPEDSKLLRP